METGNYSWVQTHKELVEYLSTKENEQLELIDLLKSLGIGPFSDRDENETDIDLTEIDPFTFFCYIHKYGDNKRLKLLKNLAKRLGIYEPEGVNGLPTAQAQKVWLFSWHYLRINDEIPRLWAFFKKAISNTITDSDFDDVLNIRNVGKTKLTEVLFYINPDKYLPINGPTKPYIEEILGLNPKFESFTHYLALLSSIKSKIEIPFYELSYKAWEWNNHQKHPNYWIFQGNPNIFDFESALKNNEVNDWTVSAHKDKIREGDKVILWITGKESGCYALAEVTSKPSYYDHSSDDHHWLGEPTSDMKAGLKITHNLIQNPIKKDEITGISELVELKAGYQGTNFSATAEQYEAMLDLIDNSRIKRYWMYAPGEDASHWEEFYAEGIMGLGWDDIGDLQQYSDKEEIKEALIEAYGGEGSKKNDVSANYDFLKTMSVGDTVIVKRGRGELLGYGIVTSGYEYHQNRSYFQKIRKVNWVKKGHWFLDFHLVLKTLTDITKYASDEPEYEMYYDRLLGIMNESKDEEEFKETPLFPLNTILYGPPGTGKTYNTIKRAAEIVTNTTIENDSEALKIYKSKLHDQIEFITFHQNYSYEDFIQGLRPDTENNNQLTFERKDGIFKIMADKAKKNLDESGKPLVAKKSFEEVFNEFFGPLVEGEVEELEVKMKKVSYYITAVTNKSIDFRKASGGSAHTLSIATLKRMYAAESVLDIQGLASYYTPLLDELLLLGKDVYGRKEVVNRKDYVLIIDEINRANISRVFGELITLIEPDKRSGGKLPMEVVLPSGEKFMVPSNLYIIGTMNTADKSIALLDIALRRRFEFESMYPKYDIEGHEIFDVEILKKINEQIIKTKGHDFQIGHSYFMGYENQDLLKRMNKKVIPLLLEYYMNDKKEVEKILQTAGLRIEEGSWPLRIEGRNE